MSLDERFRRPASLFERLLDEFGSRGEPGVGIAAAPGDGKLWPRWTEPARTQLFGARVVTAVYAEHQPMREQETAPPPPPPNTFDLAARAAQIRRELGKDFGKDLGKHLGLDDLRRLRRRCALLAHPDRAPDLDRAEAEKFMSEINAAIDEAIKSRAQPHAKR